MTLGLEQNQLEWLWLAGPGSKQDSEYIAVPLGAAVAFSRGRAKVKFLPV
jgi:hypothetical protein